MEIESMFLSSFSIEKKPHDICQLIEAAIYVAAFKYPLEFEKRKKRLLNIIMHPQPQDIHDDDDINTLDDDDDDEDSVGDEDDDDEDDDITTLDEEESVGDEDGVKQAEKEEEEGLGTQQITAQTKKPVLKFKIIIRKPVQPELIKKSWKTNNTSVASTKTERVQVAPPRVRLVSDYSFEKQLDGDKKQSHKGFKKMESTDHDTEKKREQQTPTQRRKKECTTASTKMNVVATKRVQVAPPRKELSDCSPQKQRNCSSLIKKAMQRETENSAVARPMQKETESMSDMKKKFESSKRKFTERLAEEREAKRRIVMVDFHKMPKPAKDPRAPTRRCWSRKRF